MWVYQRDSFTLYSQGTQWIVSIQATYLEKQTKMETDIFRNSTIILIRETYTGSGKTLLKESCISGKE